MKNTCFTRKKHVCHFRPVYISETVTYEKPSWQSWDTYSVGKFLENNQFNKDVIKAFSEADIHGKILPDINLEYMESIRIRKGVEKFNGNQNSAIVYVIKKLLSRSQNN